MLLDGEGNSHNPNAHVVVEAATLVLTAAERRIRIMLPCINVRIWLRWSGEEL